MSSRAKYLKQTGDSENSKDAGVCSLSPSDGERAGVRGYRETQVKISLKAASHVGPSLSFPLPVRRGEGGAAILNTLEFSNRQRTKPLDIRRLREITEATLSDLGVLHWNLGFYFVGLRRMARINQTHLKHEGPTDVITFDYSPPGSQTPKTRPHLRPELHGEAFICVAVAVTQAREFGTSWQSEVARYVIHALLHLCGYDDLKPKARREMKREENRLVKKVAR